MSQAHSTKLLLSSASYKHTHMYTHTPNQNSPKKKYKRVTCQAKETKNVIDQLKIKLKCKPENKTKAECQLGNKANKTN